MTTEQLPTESQDSDVVRDALELIPIGSDDFLAPTPTPTERIFGGQLIAQCLKAACLTVDRERTPHSLHAYFIRPGRSATELRLSVDRRRDGGSFATRHVIAVQDNQAVVEMFVSFHRREESSRHQFVDAPAVPQPDELEPVFFRLAGGAFDLRPVMPPAHDAPPWRLHPFWIRLHSDVGRSPENDASVLAYLSDIGFMGVAAVPGSPVGGRGSGSLDHSVWFHNPYDPGEWLLYYAEPVSHTNARGFARGYLFDRNGQLIASLAQEALLRPA